MVDSIAYSLSLPITSSGKKFAEQLAGYQSVPEIASRVQANAIAATVVKQYLEMMAVAASFKDAYLVDPVMPICCDTADLIILGWGRLECRVVDYGCKSCTVPADVWCDRVGYMFVSLHPDGRMAKIHGFLPQVTTEQVFLSSVEPPEALFQYFHAFGAATPTAKHPTQLHPWLKGRFTQGWEALESFFATRQYAFRGLSAIADSVTNLVENQENTAVRRAKILTWVPTSLSMPTDQSLVPNVILVVELELVEPASVLVLLQVHPAVFGSTLPTNLQFTVYAQTGRVALNAQSREADNYLQLQFRGRPDEKFSVLISIGNLSAREVFQI